MAVPVASRSVLILALAATTACASRRPEPATLTTLAAAPPAVATAHPRPELPTPPPAPEAPLLVYDGGHFLHAERVEQTVDPGEAKRVLDAVFPRYLVRACPDIPEAHRVATWTEADELQARKHAAGLFRPRVLARIRGHFLARDAQELLYVVDVGDCVMNGAYTLMTVVFDASSMAGTDPRPAPRARAETTLWGGLTVVSAVEHDGLDVLVVTGEGYEPPLEDAAVARLVADPSQRTGWSFLVSDARLVFHRDCRVALTGPEDRPALGPLGCGGPPPPSSP